VGSKTLYLQGSTAGTGELAGAIVDNPTTGSTLLSATFAAAAPTITLSSVNGITVGASISGTGIAGGTTVSAVNAATRVVTLSTPTTGAGAVGDVITVTGVSNATAVLKQGSGTWILSGNNTYTSSTTINGGALNIRNNSALGSTTGNTIIGTSAKLQIEGSGLSIPENITVTGGTIENVSGNNTLTGTITKNTNFVSLLSTSGKLTVQGGIDGTNNSVNLQGAGDGEVIGAISTAFQLNKFGAGTWTLSGVNTYANPTVVSAGTLVIGSTGSIDTSTALTVNAGAELDTTAKTSHTLPAAVTIGLDGDTDTSGLIDATGKALDIDGATVTLNVTGTLDAPSYLIAKYGSISGASAFAAITPPSGYNVNYGTGTNSTITLVQSGGSDYETWGGPYGLAAGSEGGDLDNDGLTNFEEYAFGLIPDSGSSVNPITQQLNKSSGVFKYKRRNSALATGVTYSYEYSTTLSGAWSPLTLATAPMTDGASPTEEITVTVDPSLLTNPKLFVRVKAVK
jgi:autotransporter-associated beta strand protein